MKKLMITALVALGIVGVSNAQEYDFSDNPVLNRKHELRLDAVDILGFVTAELNYEYVISKYSGAGAALSISLGDKDIYEYGQKFAFTPFYRQYFLNKKDFGARGLFVEGMMQMAAGEYTYYDYQESNGSAENFMTNEDWFNVGAGLAIGQKWVSNNGFVFELSAGLGRYFTSDDFQPGFFFRGGVLVGYRF